MRSILFANLCAVLLCGCALAEEETFNATEIVLRDGRQLMAVRTAQDGNSIITLDGQRINLRADEIQTKADKQLAVSALPANIRDALGGNGSASTSAVGSALQALNDARAKENAAALAADQAAKELAAAQAELLAARGAPASLAPPGGRFGSQTTCPYCSAGLPCPMGHRTGTDFEERAMLDIARQEAAANLARLDDQIKQLTEKNDDAKAKLEAAKTVAQAALSSAVQALLTAR